MFRPHAQRGKLRAAEMGLPELVLMRELRELCSSPVPSEPSFAFEDDPCDSSFEPTASESSAILSRRTQWLQQTLLASWNRLEGNEEVPFLTADNRAVKFVVCLVQLFSSCKYCSFRTVPSLRSPIPGMLPVEITS